LIGGARLCPTTPCYGVALRVKQIAYLLVLTVLLITGCESSALESDPSTRPTADIPPLGLWTASGEPAEILRLGPLQLHGTGKLAPAATITTTNAGRSTLTSMAFSQHGTLWLASVDDSLLLAFAPTSLETSGNKTASNVIASFAGSLRGPSGIAFDGLDGLWVANHDAGTLVRYDHEQLATGGHPAPAITVSGLSHPTALAFDEAGALWVTDNEDNTISRYDVGQLMVTGLSAPTVVVTAMSDCLSAPAGIAFDAAGNLWIANLGCANVIAFSKSQLALAGALRPSVILSSHESAPINPVGLAFDDDGDLWVLGATGALMEFARTNLGTSGAPNPRSRLEVSGHNLFWGLAFWPTPRDLPLH